MHYSLGFPVIGLTQIEGTYPFQMPNVFFDDFNAIGSADFSAAATAITSTAKYYVGGNTGGAAPTISAATITQGLNTDGGTLKMITTANAGDSMCAKPVGGFIAADYTVGSQNIRPFFYQARFTPTAVAASSQAVGLCSIAGVNGVTSPFLVQAIGAYFLVVNGAVQVSYKFGSTTFAAAAVTYLEGPNTGSAVTVAATATVTCSIRYDGKGGIRFFVNGLLVKSAQIPAFTVTAIAPFWGLLGNAQTCEFDYVYAAGAASNAGRS